MQGHQLIDLEKWEREEGDEGGRGKKRTARKGGLGEEKEGGDRENDTDGSEESRTGKRKSKQGYSFPVHSPGGFRVSIKKASLSRSVIA